MSRWSALAVPVAWGPEPHLMANAILMSSLDLERLDNKSEPTFVFARIVCKAALLISECSFPRFFFPLDYEEVLQGVTDGQVVRTLRTF